MFNYKPREQRLSEMISQLASNTNINRFNSAGAKARYLMDIFNNQLDQLILLLDNNLSQFVLSTASGAVLDFLADIFTGLKRKTPVTPNIIPSDRTFLIYTDRANFGSLNKGLSILIPSGTLLHDGNPNVANRVKYLLTEAVRLAPTSRGIYVGAIADGPSAKNNVPPNTINFIDFRQYNDSANLSLRVTNEQPINTASDLESDFDFRFRISQHKLTEKTSNETAVRLAALSVPGVSDIIIDKYADGIGTADLIVISTSPVVSQSLINLVKDEVDKVVSMGSNINVLAPLYYGVSADITLIYKSTSVLSRDNEIKSKVLRELNNYFNNLNVGQNVSFNFITNLIINTDPDIYDILPLEEMKVYIPSKVDTSNKKAMKITKGWVLPSNIGKLIPEFTLTRPFTINSQVVKNINRAI